MYHVNKYLVLTLWWYIPVIPALRRWRQNWEFKASLGNMVRPSVCHLLRLMSSHAITQRLLMPFNCTHFYLVSQWLSWLTEKKGM